MTDEDYRTRILSVERYAERLSFLCPPLCPDDFWSHAEALARYLSDCIDADYYEVERPTFEGCEHLRADAARHLRHFDEVWRRA